MFTRRSTFISLAIIISLVVTSQVALADSHGSQRSVVFVADRASIARAPGGADLARSAVSLVSTMGQGDSYTFIVADKPDEVLGPAASGTVKFDVLHEQLYADTGPSLAPPPPDYVGALTRAYNLLNSTLAPRGSTVFLVTGPTSDADLSVELDRLGSTLGLMSSAGWPVMGLRLPGASQEVAGFLDDVAAQSGGESFEISAPGGFKVLADTIFRDEARGSLTELGERTLAPNEVFTSSLSIAPGTGDVTLMFFKEDPYGSLRLSNPSGLEASAGDRTESSVVQTSHFVFWRLVDPAPGEWTVEVRGMDGAVSAWHFATNRYTVALVSYGAVPLNEPTTLVTYVTDGSQRVALSDVRVTARVTTPDGTSLAHELNDEGRTGDARAGDGYYSGTIPPVTVEGIYEIELELSWPEFAHIVSSQASFRGQGFPVVEVNAIETDELRPNERTRVATVLVHVAGQPFSVSAEQLMAGFSSNVDDAGVLEIIPQRLLDGDRAWMYDVFFTPRREGFHTLNFQLNLEYAGRQYTYASDYVILSSFIPESPVAPATAVPATAAPATAAPQSSAPQPPPVLAEPESSGFPWPLVIGVVIALGALGAAAAVYWFTRKGPYGYLYNDRDEPVVDFSTLKRRPIMRLLFKNLVRGKELGISGLEGVSFSFSRGKIALTGQRGAATIRVNNQPLVGRATVYERAWIGTAGRLYGLFLSSPPFEPQLSAGDD